MESKIKKNMSVSDLLSTLTMSPSCTLLSYLLHVLESGRGQSHNHKPFAGEAGRDGRGALSAAAGRRSGWCAVLAGHNEVPLVTAA